MFPGDGRGGPRNRFLAVADGGVCGGVLAEGPDPPPEELKPLDALPLADGEAVGRPSSVKTLPLSSTLTLTLPS
jgi:hypothetical protein